MLKLHFFKNFKIITENMSCFSFYWIKSYKFGSIRFVYEILDLKRISIHFVKNIWLLIKVFVLKNIKFPIFNVISVTNQFPISRIGVENI